jgi:hypothetical protein
MFKIGYSAIFLPKSMAYATLSLSDRAIFCGEDKYSAAKLIFFLCEGMR